MHIVFVGNCQVQTLAAILRRFVSPYVAVTTEFLDAFSGNTTHFVSRVKSADAVVAQPVVQDVIAATRAHIVPAVSGAFLYPYSGTPHPAAAVERTGIAPFSAEYSDRYLGRLYIARTPASDALSRYRDFNVAKAAAVERRYELALEGQRALEAKTGYACADIIERYLGEEQLFQSAHHFGGRIARHLASTLCDRLELDAKYGQRVRDHLIDAPFARLFVPVHPSVAHHFGMRWVSNDTPYPYRYEGSFTFDEYVIRFMEVKWSEAIQAGVVAFQKNDPGCKALLERGLAEAPRSAEGSHALSCIAEREGDMQTAIALQQRASRVALDGYIPARLGQLLKRAGDYAGAESAFKAALRLDSINPVTWSGLREVLTRMNRLAEAAMAARQERVFATDPGPASEHAARLQQRIANDSSKDIQHADSQPSDAAAELLAHISGQGDRPSDLEGWVGTRGSKRAVEGFMILQCDTQAFHGISYQAILHDGSLSALVPVGRYCGTRGRNQPLRGLRLMSDPDPPSTGEVTCEAYFVDGTYSGKVGLGTACQAESGARLETFRILFGTSS